MQSLSQIIKTPETAEKVFVPYGCTVHGEEEIQAVVQVLKTSTQMGKNVADMEHSIAKLFVKKYGVMVNSGTSANFLAIELLNLPAGSEVITPILTFATTVSPLIKHNLLPAFVDVERDTFNIDANKICEMITPNTKAMFIPNLLGNLPDWPQLRAIADEYNLILIEDSADTLNGFSRGLPTGQYSDMSTTSFYGSHIINCAGNGGMLCSSDEKIVQQAKLLRSWGRSSSLFAQSEAIENRFNIELEGVRYDAKFIFETLGYNYEPSEMGAAFGLVQLKKLSANISKRIQHFKMHMSFFAEFSDWLILPRQAPQTQTAWLAFPLIIKDAAPFTRTQMQIYLEERNIQTRTVFTGNILKQPGFVNIHRKESPAPYIHADLVMRGGILLACHHGLTEPMIAHMYETLRTYFQMFK